MRTPKILLCALILCAIPAASGLTAETHLYGGIGRGSPLNPGALIAINQDTGAGALVGHPDSVPGLSGLVFDISGILYGTTISGEIGTGRFSNLVRIDPGTGAQIGPAVPITANDLPIPITDLALQPGTNTLYGTRLIEEDLTNSIYTINPATGVATLIGNTGVIGATIAFGPDGTLGGLFLYSLQSSFNGSQIFPHARSFFGQNLDGFLRGRAKFRLHLVKLAKTFYWVGPRAHKYGIFIANRVNTLRGAGRLKWRQRSGWLLDGGDVLPLGGDR
jgi:hypothetical protein